MVVADDKLLVNANAERLFHVRVGIYPTTVIYPAAYKKLVAKET